MLLLQHFRKEGTGSWLTGQFTEQGLLKCRQTWLCKLIAQELVALLRRFLIVVLWKQSQQNARKLWWGMKKAADHTGQFILWLLQNGQCCTQSDCISTVFLRVNWRPISTDRAFCKVNLQHVIVRPWFWLYIMSNSFYYRWGFCSQFYLWHHNPQVCFSYRSLLRLSVCWLCSVQNSQGVTSQVRTGFSNKSTSGQAKIMSLAKGCVSLYKSYSAKA